MTTSETRAIFSLHQAREMLPQVKHLTADAVRQAESLAVQLTASRKTILSTSACRRR